MRLCTDSNYGHRSNGWVVKLLLGTGAGYIGGSTAFVAWKSGSLKWSRIHRNGELSCYPEAPWKHGYFRVGKLEFGWTRNANIVPSASH